MTHNESHIHAEHSHEGSKTCRLCTSAYSHEKNPSHFGICEKCAYKVLILLVIVMISVSYIAWFGVF